MVKHNNVIPNQHFHKKWADSSRGPLKVITWFDQAGKKKSRRLARKTRASAIAPRPTAGLLRPIVHCPTLKYNAKLRLGRGFTIEELKEAGFSKKYARTVGIAVDHRRTNKSVESLQANVQRLKEYKARLVVFPRKSNRKPRRGDSSFEETSQAVQLNGTIMPLRKQEPTLEFATLTEEMKSSHAYSSLRAARNNVKMVGIRKKKLAEKQKATN